MTHTIPETKPATIFHRYHEAAKIARHINDNDKTLEDGLFVSVRPVTDGFIIEIYADEGYRTGVI